jgi:hypothetical protein
MPGETRNGMQCAEFDALLSEALDQKLSGQKLESFQAHSRVCPVCGPLLAEAQEGRRWLKSMAEVEPPSNLVHNILVATIGRESAAIKATAKPKVSWSDVVTGWLRPTFAPVFAVARQPRFVMSFGMAFFSISVALSMAGVKVSDLRQVDLRPTAIKRTYYETYGRVVKSYENIRLVYEIESRVRELKRATTPAEPAPAEQNKERKNDTSGQPEQKQERNYSQGENEPVLASIPNHPPVVTTTTYRRFV